MVSSAGVDLKMLVGLDFGLKWLVLKDSMGLGEVAALSVSAAAASILCCAKRKAQIAVASQCQVFSFFQADSDIASVAVTWHGKPQQ